MKDIGFEKQMMVFDLLEGNLDSASAQKVQAQIDADPNMKREYLLMQKTYLLPEPIVFNEKESLKQPALEMQMLVFDLLEGNLDEAESARVMEMLEKDPALKKEFTQLQHTYLTQEPMFYEDKAGLKKKTGGIFYMNTYRSAIAAGMLLLLSGLGYVGWRFAGENETNNTSALAGKSGTQETGMLPQEPEKAVDLSIVAPFAHAQKSTGGIAISEPVPKTWTGVPAPVLPGRQLAMSGVDDVLPPVLADDEMEISYIYLDNTAFQEPVSYERKRSLGHKLLYSTRRMLAQLKTPEIGISVKNTGHLFPKVEMSYKTDKEEVIATLIE